MIPSERQVVSNQVESAWPDHPDYRIAITPCQHTGQVWHDDTLIAESDDGLDTNHAFWSGRHVMYRCTGGRSDDRRNRL